MRESAGEGVARVLEIGGGGSRVLPYIAKRFGYRAFATDYSPEGCQALRANFISQGLAGTIICEDLFRSSLPANYFDLVFSSGLIEHFDDQAAVVREHIHLLKPGGRLVLIVPNLLGLQGKVCRRLAPMLWERHRVFGPEGLAEWLRSSGLTSVRFGYLGSFLLRVGSDPDWSVVSLWPRWVQRAVYWSVRLGNALISFFFRLSPWRPHSRLLSPAFFAAGTKPQ